MEHIESKDSWESNLQIDPICSIRILPPSLLTAHDSSNSFDKFDNLLFDSGLAESLMRVIGKAKLLQEALLVENGHRIQEEQRRLQESEQTEHI